MNWPDGIALLIVVGAGWGLARMAVGEIRRWRAGERERCETPAGEASTPCQQCAQETCARSVVKQNVSSARSGLTRKNG